MPIKGLSEKRRITRGGFLRLGEMVQTCRCENGHSWTIYPDTPKPCPECGKSMKTTTRKHPMAEDHFVPDFDNWELITPFMKLYGQEPSNKNPDGYPNRVTIAFASNDPEQIFPQYYMCYGKDLGLKCKGDGIRADKTTENGNRIEVDCPGASDCQYGRENECGKRAFLQYFIKGLPCLQVFQTNTTSYHSIVNLNSQIALLQTIRGGRTIAGVWVSLMLKPQNVQPDGKKKVVHVLDIEIPVSLDSIQELTSQFETPLGLPPPIDDKKDPLLNPPHGFEPPDEPYTLDKPNANGFAPDPDRDADPGPEPKPKSTANHAPNPDPKPTNGDPLAEVKKTMAEVGWTNADMKALLKKHYKNRTSRELTEAELADLPESIRAAASMSKKSTTEDGW